MLLTYENGVFVIRPENTVENHDWINCDSVGCTLKMWPFETDSIKWGLFKLVDFTIDDPSANCNKDTFTDEDKPLIVYMLNYDC